MMRKLISLLFVVAFVTPSDGYSRLFHNGGGNGVGGGGGGGGTTLATITFVNDSASTQPAGIPTHTFYVPFKDGDICGGSTPKFLDGVTVQKFSWGLQSYWNSGCLKGATFMLLPTFSVAGSGSHPITISSGGTAPSTSSRTLTEVYSQSLSAGGTINVSLRGLTGLWKSWLGNSGSADANQYGTPRHWLTGDAGEGWSIDTKMSQTQGGTPDGFYKFRHYIISLNNAGGTLGGFRWMGMMRNPFYNAPSPATNGYTFWNPPDSITPSNGLYWQVGVTQTAVAWTWPGPGLNWTVAGGQQNTTVPHNFYTGADSAGNIIPVTITSTGTLPTCNPALVQTGAYRAVADGLSTFGSPTTSFGLEMLNGSSITCSNNGTGIHTIRPWVELEPFTRVPFATKDALYNFFKGSGSITTETSLRVKIDQAYWHKSKLLPPYDLTLQGASNGGVGANAVPDNPSYDYQLYNIGKFNSAQETPGDHPDLGPLPQDSAVDFYNQSFNSFKMIRNEGLSFALEPLDFKDAANDTLPVVNNTTYTGLSTPNNQLQVCSGTGGASGGFTLPANGPQPVVYSQCDGSHRPQYMYMAFIRTGELQYYDFLLELANGSMLTLYQACGSCGLDFRNPPFPYQAYGLVTSSSQGGELRDMAWDFRDIAYGAGICSNDPTSAHPVFSDGTQTCKYLLDQARANAKWPGDVMNNTISPTIYGSSRSYVVGQRSMYIPQDGHGNVAAYQGGAYEFNFFTFGFNIAAAILEDSNALSFLASVAARNTATANRYGAYHIYGISELAGWPGGIGGFGATWMTPGVNQGNGVGVLMSNDTQWGTTAEGAAPVINWVPQAAPDATHLAFTATDPGASCFAIANGTRYASNGVPAGFNQFQFYYMVQVNGLSFNFSATKGGPPIATTDSGQFPGGNGYFTDDPTTANIGPDTACWPAFGANPTYPISAQAAWLWAKAVGATGFGDSVNGLIGDATRRLAAFGYTRATGSAQAPHYSMQDHFGP